MSRLAGFALRLVGALLLVFATYNPEGHSYTHWVMDGNGVTPPKALAGVVLTIGWVAAFTMSWRSLGVIGTGLAGALVGTLLWTVMSWANAEVGARGITYVTLVAIAFVLAVAMSWSSWWKRGRRGSRADGDES